VVGYVDKAGLQVASELAEFVEKRVLPGTGIAAEAFWAGAADIFGRFAPRNQALLEKRDAIQAAIDHWHKARADQPQDAAANKAFLTELGYLVAEPAPFTVNPVNVDRGLAKVAGPQLVVPVLNARLSLPRSHCTISGVHAATAAPARSTSSSPRCTSPRKQPSPTVCSTRSRICWASPATR